MTHHGLNSTHEAIAAATPMLSYPFFGDQPAMAATCRGFGVAVPLVEDVRGPLRADDIRAALSRIEAGDAMARDLERARGWELDVIAGRPAVLARIAALIAGGRSVQHGDAAAGRVEGQSSGMAAEPQSRTA